MVPTPDQLAEAARAQLGAGRLDAAEAAYRQLFAAAPGRHDALHGLGLVALRRGRYPDAAGWLFQAVRLDQRNPLYCTDLGRALAAAGRHEEAVVWQRAVLSLQNDYPGGHANLADSLLALGRAGEAVPLYRAELAARPDDFRALNNLATALESSDYDESVACYRRALELRPDHPAVSGNLGRVLAQAGRVTEAVAYYRDAVRQRPDDAALYGRLLMAIQFDPAADAAAVRAEHRRWADRLAAPLARQSRPHANDRTPGRRVRVGYVSPDFRDHVVGWLIEPVLARHDRGRFEVFCYSDAARPDHVTARIRPHACGWRETAGWDDARLAEQIRADRIDVLVDLAQHAPGNRQLVFARRPAPAQVTYLGYNASTGSPAMDYRVTDPYFDPPGADPDGPEALLRLPRCYWAYRPPAGTPAVGPPAVLRNGFVTFGAFNNYAKTAPAVLDAWAQILRDVPDAALHVATAGADATTYLPAAFEARGVARGRVRLQARRAALDYFHLYNDVDLCLDPFPYNGGVTSLDALWMGVPVVTLAGARPVSRAGVSLLNNIGLPELIAADGEGYVKKAVELARDRDGLVHRRGVIRDRLRASPLMDEVQFTRDLEALYLRAWEAWRVGGRATG